MGMEFTCPACGLTFDTQATTNTRCRGCRNVVNIGARSQSATSARRTSDDTPEVSGLIIGDVLMAGGVVAIWHGVNRGAASETSADGSTSRSGTWLWCGVGGVPVGIGLYVLLRS
jgi:DNA-directed RNA polymerase subunit RPC12/RpoP